MMQRLYRDERGDLSYFTIFVILAVNMLLAFVLLFATVKINSINIRNAAKMELKMSAPGSMPIRSIPSVKQIWSPT